MVTDSNEALLVTTTVKVTVPPGSGIWVGDADLSTLMVACSTRTGTWNWSSQTHFDFVSGSKSVALAIAQPVPWLLCQLVQFGRFRKPSPSESRQRTPGIVNVTLYVPELRSPHVS